MNKLLDKLRRLRRLKPTNENWVSKILKKRIFKPIIIAIIISLLILSNNLYESYKKASTYKKKEEVILHKIIQEKKRFENLNIMINNQTKKISYLQGMHVDAKEPIMILTKVCNLLKARDVIGSFYIKKLRSKKFTNVLNIQIEISYGDKELLFLVTKIVLEKVFYLKKIEKTENGLKCELFKPSK